MKKFFVILLSFIYLATMSGVVFHAHYCGDRLVSLSIGAKGDACEGGGQPAKCKKCCKDKQITYKGSHEQNTVPAFKVQRADMHFAVATKVAEYPTFINGRFFSYRADVYAPNAPPGEWQQIPLYKLHSSLTYYG